MITPCTSADLPILAEMLHDLHVLHVHHRPDRFHDLARPEDRQAFLADRMAQGARLLGYNAGNTLRGYLMWSPLEMPRTALEHPRRQAVLDHVYVEPSWRRRGLGSRLMAQFQMDMAAFGYDSWLVRVHSFNAASLGLMRRHGAVPRVTQLEAPNSAVAGRYAPVWRSSPATMPA